MKNRDRITSRIMDMAAATVLEDPSYVAKWDVSDWLAYGEVPSDFRDLPNAVAAQEVMNSPLYKAMEEEN